jgi:hypothetical protein
VANPFIQTFPLRGVELSKVNPPVPPTVLIRLSDAEHQVKLLIFLWNSEVKAIERIGADSLRIADESINESELRRILGLWQNNHPAVSLEISP